MNGEKRGGRNNAGFKRDMFWVSTLGINLVLSSFAGVGLGYFLDHLFKTQPVLTIVFFFVGTFAGFRQIYKEIMKMAKEEENKSDKRH